MPRSLFRAALRALALAGALCAVSVSSASAAAPYTTGETTGCGGLERTGGRDRAGSHYLPCGTTAIRITAVDGVVRDVPIDVPEGMIASRIAPSPDGRYLYTLSVDGPGRFELVGGRYVLSPMRFELPVWSVATWRICGKGVATDAYGYIYFSNGGWCDPAPNQILKYRPDGSVVTVFGDYGVADAKGSLPGQFQPNQGLAVTPDGSRVWVADQLNQRVQFFDRRENETYGFAGMWSGEGTAWDGQLGAVYDVALDLAGNAFVTQTTTRQIWRLTPHGTDPVLVARADVVRPHAVAVDALGRVTVGEWDRRFDPTVPVALPVVVPALPPEPRPDLTSPVIVAVAVVERPVEGLIEVTVRATDDAGVRQMRFADESGEWGPWVPYAETSQLPVIPRVGVKALYVQVRDRLERESLTHLERYGHAPGDDVTPPTLTLAATDRTSVLSVAIQVTTNDDRGVTDLRVAGGDGAFGEWRAWAGGMAELAHELEPGLGLRVVTVQVRDAAQNVTEARHQITVEPLPLPAPPRQPQPEVPVEPQPQPQPAPVLVPGPAAPAPATALQPGPAPDRAAPMIRAVSIPARSCTRRIAVVLSARDDRRVTHVRFANEKGAMGAWRAYRYRSLHLLSAGPGRKLVTVQVRDAAGNVSRATSRRLLATRCSTVRRPSGR